MDQQILKTRSDLHMPRKIWHISGVVLILVIFHNVSRPTALQLITFFAFVFIFVDILRQQSEVVNNFVMTMFKPIMREGERNTMAGTSYLLLGVFLIILFFPKKIVMLALMFLALADPMASYIGVKYGRDKILGNKSLQGTLAAFVACFLISAIFYWTQNLMVERILIVSLLSGFIGAFSELVPIGRLDDNFSIPITSSCLLWILFKIFGGF